MKIHQLKKGIDGKNYGMEMYLEAFIFALIN
jgi:hypothetical protein